MLDSLLLVNDAVALVLEVVKDVTLVKLYVRVALGVVQVKVLD